MKKTFITDSCDFFSSTLKESLEQRLGKEHSINTIPFYALENEIKKSYFDYLIFGITNNDENEFLLISKIKKNYYHANIIVIAQNLTIEGIKKLKYMQINNVLLKPVNIKDIVERLQR